VSKIDINTLEHDHNINMTPDSRTKEMKTELHFRSCLLRICVFSISMVLNTAPFLNAFAQNNNPVLAESIFQDKSLTLPQNLKHLIILIPNEAHESQNPGDATSEQRLINQTYIPQNAIVSPGTMITWFNGDVDHDRKITLVNELDQNNIIFDSGTFAFNEGSDPIVLNDTGTFNYYETDANNEDEDFVMNGTITVVDQQNSNAALPNMSSTASSSNPTGTLGKGDTAGTLMVPTEDVDMYVQDLTSKGFTMDSTYNFNDIRAGDEQTLLVWTTSGKNLDEVISTLQEITPQLPYS
jgi:plastocyanin